MNRTVTYLAGGLLAACLLGPIPHAGAQEHAVNINTASAAELATLKGIGPAKAADIVAYREKNGPFRSAEDLADVKGIGDKLVAALKPSISVGGAAPAAASDGVARRNH